MSARRSSSECSSLGGKEQRGCLMEEEEEAVAEESFAEAQCFSLPFIKGTAL